jgi:hypothetical protein
MLKQDRDSNLPLLGELDVAIGQRDAEGSESCQEVLMQRLVSSVLGEVGALHHTLKQQQYHMVRTDSS